MSDLHTCPAVTGNVPHVGGPVSGGCTNVLIGGSPAARAGDMATCAGPPDAISAGATNVLIGGAPAARLGDATSHGGAVASGLPTVLIGTSGAQAVTLQNAADAGASFCEDCEYAKSGQ